MCFSPLIALMISSPFALEEIALVQVYEHSHNKIRVHVILAEKSTTRGLYVGLFVLQVMCSSIS